MLASLSAVPTVTGVEVVAIDNGDDGLSAHGNCDVYVDGFLAIEKYLLVKRGLFASDRRRQPNAWSLDKETSREVDRLFALLRAALAE